jgi:hypothetical protein
MPLEPLDPIRSELRQAALQLNAAEAGLGGALRWSRMTGSVDATVDLLCELAETAATRTERLDGGDRDDAVDLRARALRLMAGDAAAPADPWRLPGVRDA